MICNMLTRQLTNFIINALANLNAELMRERTPASTSELRFKLDKLANEQTTSQLTYHINMTFLRVDSMVVGTNFLLNMTCHDCMYNQHNTKLKHPLVLTCDKLLIHLYTAKI